MKSKNLAVLGLSSVLLAGLSGCKKDQDDSVQEENVQPKSPLAAAEELIEGLDGTLKLAIDSSPTNYLFKRDGKDTVDTKGQIFRQLLIEDLKTYVGTLKRSTYAGAPADLLAVLDSFYTYRYDNSLDLPELIKGSSAFKLNSKGIDGSPLPVAEGSLYQDIQDPGKNLREKTAGNDNPLLRGELKGWSTLVFNDQNLKSIDADKKADPFVEPEDLIQAFFQIVAAQAVDGQNFVVVNGDQPQQLINEAFITESGLDLNQLIQKFLHVSVSYSQATEDYLGQNLGQDKGLNADNTAPAKAGVSYTNLEHFWDEAFGYFGASRDFLAYSDQQVGDGLSIDTDGNGKISFLQEKNFGIAVNTAKRDLGAKDGKVDFSKEAMNALIQGRHLLSSKPEGYLPVVKAMAVIAASRWEKTLAATVVHYSNRVSKEMQEFGTNSYSFKDHAKFWSEMKGFALGFQFSPYAEMSAEDFDMLHSLLGDRPVLLSEGQDAAAAYLTKLAKARSILQKTYGFSDDNTQNW